MSSAAAAQSSTPQDPVVSETRAAVPDSTASATVFLVGDAGLINDERSILLAHLGDVADSIAAAEPNRRRATVYLGDNIYNEGIRPDHRAEDIAVLEEQVTLGGRGGDMPVYFISGNHDWGDGNDIEEMLPRVQEQAAAIDSLGALSGRTASLFPEAGCPGPHVEDLGALRLIFVDTEWLVQRAELCGGEVARERMVEDLELRLDEVLGLPTLILAHHPIETGGPHGGGGNVLDKVWKWLRSTRQDLGSSRYDDMVDDLLAAIDRSQHQQVMVASGHEHSLQVIEVEEDDVELVQIVSGSGAKLTSVSRVDGTVFRAKRRGYVRLDVDGAAITVSAWGLNDDGAMEQLWVGSLFAATPPPEEGS